MLDPFHTLIWCMVILVIVVCVCVICSCRFSQVCAEALLETLELMSKLRQQVKDMETSFYRMLQVHAHISPHALHCLLRFLFFFVCDLLLCVHFICQDQRIVTPLSLALTSHHRERVQTGLCLLFEATPLPDFPSLM